jgi:heptaprenylglyceryl phosphate synthase
MLKKLLHKNIVNGKKTLALLIDPDKHNDKSLVELLSLAGNRDVPHIILIGGSIVFNGIEENESFNTKGKLVVHCMFLKKQ